MTDHDLEHLLKHAPVDDEPLSDADRRAIEVVDRLPMTTYEKLQLLRDEALTADPEQMPDDARKLVTGLQIAAGGGFDVFDLLLPDDPTDADVMVEKMLDLLLQIRGDDLPPYRAPVGVRVVMRAQPVALKRGDQ